MYLGSCYPPYWHLGCLRQTTYEGIFYDFSARDIGSFLTVLFFSIFCSGLLCCFYRWSVGLCTVKWLSVFVTTTLWSLIFCWCTKLFWFNRIPKSAFFDWKKYIYDWVHKYLVCSAICFHNYNLITKLSRLQYHRVKGIMLYRC